LSRWKYYAYNKQNDDEYKRKTACDNEKCNYADFYALMPPDNAATVAPRTDIQQKMVLNIFKVYKIIRLPLSYRLYDG